nr:ATP-grasp domain-containing protein [Candidatus Neomarinimicrobiota bacterium]
EASELCMDKSRSKAVARNLGVKTADWELLHHVYETYSIGLPFVVKPNTQGSTVGLTVVHNKNEIKPAIKDAFVHGKSVMIEKYINGRELTVTVLGGKAYPIVEIQPSHNLYDYECKYTPGMSKYICPADLSPKLTNKIKRDTENIFKGLGCEVYGRADYLLADDGQYFFLEMNTLPGMTDTSLVPKAVAAEGLSFEKLVKKIIELSQ